MRRYIIWAAIILLCTLEFYGQAVTLTKDKDHVIGTREFQVFIDASQILGVNEVIEKKFRQWPKNSIRAENPEDHVWIRFKLESSKLSEGHWYLEAMDPRFDEIEVFYGHSDGYKQIAKTGIKYPFSSREIEHKNFLFQLPHGQENVSILVKVQSREYSLILFKVRSESYLFKYALAEYFWLALFYGTLLALAVYYGMIYFRVRENTYFHFVHYILATILVAILEDGIGFQYVWPSSPMLNYILIQITPVVYMISFIAFSNSFLDLKTYFPRPYKLLWLLTGLFCINILIKWVVDPSIYFLCFSIPLCFLLMFYLAYRRVQMGMTSRFDILAAYFTVFVAVVVNILRRYTMLDVAWDSIFMVYFLNFACLLEILLLSCAKTDKFRLIKLEKDRVVQKSEEIHQESEARLAEKNQELARYIKSNDELKSFAHTVSHDLRQPLRTIGGFASLMKHKLDKLESDEQPLKEYTELIMGGVKNMNQLISGLLEYGTVNKQVHDNYQSHNLAEIIAHVIQNLHQQIQENEVTISTSNLPEKIVCVQVKMIQLFQNLISNSIKFRSPDRQPLIMISCKESVEAFEFQLSDNGRGIPKEDLQHIFKLFFRIPDTNQSEGSGIGLALCQKIVEQHEGEIRVESEPGVGTVFTFSIAKEPKTQLKVQEELAVKKTS